MLRSLPREEHSLRELPDDVASRPLTQSGEQHDRRDADCDPKGGEHGTQPVPGEGAQNFSLFSWLRRDKPSEPEPPKAEPGSPPKAGGE
jgi:hypothetical protein